MFAAIKSDDFKEKHDVWWVVFITIRQVFVTSTQMAPAFFVLIYLTKFVETQE